MNDFETTRKLFLSHCGHRAAEARKKTSRILRHASPELRGDQDLIRFWLQRDCKTLLIASAQLQMNPDIVALACQHMSGDTANSFWLDFRSSSMRQLYVDRAKELMTELKTRNHPNHMFII